MKKTNLTYGGLFLRSVTHIQVMFSRWLCRCFIHYDHVISYWNQVLNPQLSIVDCCVIVMMMLLCYCRLHLGWFRFFLLKSRLQSVQLWSPNDPRQESFNHSHHRGSRMFLLLNESHESVRGHRSWKFVVLNEKTQHNVWRSLPQICYSYSSYVFTLNLSLFHALRPRD
jgi:hypothetical protein